MYCNYMVLNTLDFWKQLMLSIKTVEGRLPGEKMPMESQFLGL